jgi:hypothetical protein
MVDYGAAFKLPFTDWKKFSIFYLLVSISLAVPAFFFGKIFVQLMTIQNPEDTAALFSGIDIGTLLLSGIVFLVFNLLVTGYGLRLQANAANGRNALPSFNNIIGLLTIALKLTLGVGIYLAILMFVYLIIAMSFIVLPGLLKLIGVILIILVIAPMIISVYAFPMLIVHFASQNRFTALFEIKTALKYSFKLVYFLSWLIAFGYSYLVGMAAYLVAMIVFLALSPVNLMLAIIVALELYLISFWIVQVTKYSLYGQAYNGIAHKKAKVIQSAKPYRKKAKRSKK